MSQGVVPSIDIAPFFSRDPAARQHVAHQIGRACEEIGFLCITGHGVQKALIDEMAATSRQFFDLPLADKLSAPVNSIGAGYVAMQAEALAASLGQKTPGDLKESFNAGRDFDAMLWPPALPELRDVWRRYFAQVKSLSETIMRAFALALDLPEAFFDDKIEPPQAFLRAINYPEQAVAPLEGQLRAGAHSDYGTLTVLLSEDKPGGLQVRAQNGEWVDVIAPPGAFVINIGDMMQLWTNDRWRSTVHRVVNPSGDAKSSRRQSLVFFHSPNEQVLIEPLATCVSAERPARYAPILAGEHMRIKSSKAGTLAK
jgi:isopenicillin N synthase-like dioxygenase